MGNLITLAESRGFAKNFHALSLGQGQAPIASRYLLDGIKEVRGLAIVCQIIHLC